MGVREAGLWLGTKNTFRCLVRLVRAPWFVTVSKEMVDDDPAWGPDPKV